MIYSQHLGEIRDELFHFALDRFRLGDFVSAEAIPYGLFGQNVFLTSTKGQFVFRGQPRYYGQFKNERFIAEHLHKETKAPVPWPYLLDESDDIFGWPYVIMPRMRGLQLESRDVKSKLSAVDRLEIAKAMGENLAEMQKLQYPHSGLYDPATDSVLHLDGTYRPPWEEKAPTDRAALLDATVPSEKVFQRWVSSRINYFLNNALESNDPTTGRITTPGDVEWIASILDDSRAALLEPFHPCFVMDDYKEGNMVAEKTHGRWRITGVFDFMTAYFGDGEADLSRPLTRLGISGKGSNEWSSAFLDAYLHSRENQIIRPGFLERFVVYVLMDQMIMWAYGRKLGWYDMFADFRSLCEPRMGLIPEILHTAIQGAFGTQGANR